MINALEWHPMMTPWSLGVWEVSSQFTDTIQHVRWYTLYLSHLSTSFHLPWMGKNKLKKKGDLTSLITSCTNATKIITLTIDFDCICGLSEWNIDQYKSTKVNIWTPLHYYLLWRELDQSTLELICCCCKSLAINFNHWVRFREFLWRCFYNMPIRWTCQSTFTAALREPFLNLLHHMYQNPNTKAKLNKAQPRHPNDDDICYFFMHCFLNVWLICDW